MPNYVVTGKLGGGKTLVSVGRMRDYLLRGCRVATNIDLNLRQMLGKNHKSARVVRLPDSPTASDMEMLGNAYSVNTGYDDSKNGLIVLDECGYWLNSRGWNDKERKLIIDWFLHARKHGWDVIFIVQDISIMDKQARLSLAEHVVYCRRTDRMSVPFLGAFFKFLTGSRLNPPKIHFAIVKYGADRNSPTVDKWIYRGTTFYSMYDTRQVYTASSKPIRSLLPPSYYSIFPSHNFKIGTIMRMTKIYFKKFSKAQLFVYGCLFSFFSMFLFNHYDYFVPDRILSGNFMSFKKEDRPKQTEADSLELLPDPEKVLDTELSSSALSETHCEDVLLSTFQQGSRVFILTGRGIVPLSSWKFPVTSQGVSFYSCVPPGFIKKNTPPPEHDSLDEFPPLAQN